MSILVICPGCKKNFRVSEKFAGKQGPCPACKVVITVPQPEEVKIHTPEEFEEGGRDTKGKLVSKPIERKETKITMPLLVGMIGGGLVVLATAWLLGDLFQESAIAAGLGLAVISPPLAVGFYQILRDDELEPHSGVALWIRGTICGLAYAATWAAFSYVLLSYYTPEAWSWLFVAPPFFVLGSLVALGCFDLDMGTGAIHYGFYVLITLGLRFIAGFPPLWAAIT